MIHTTKGIVLHSFKYGETSIIARILTPDFGLQSYLVQGARKPKSSIKANIFRPLTMVEMVVYHKDRQGLQRIKEIHRSHALDSFDTDIRKTSLVLFISEILLKTTKHQENQQVLFPFLIQKINELNTKEDHFSDFHIVFLIQLTRYLGFAPTPNYSTQSPYFNLKEGKFQERIDSPDCLDPALGQHLFFHIASDSDPGKSLPNKLNRASRNHLLDKLIVYYKIHIEDFGEVKSLDTLRVLFNPMKS